MKTSLHVWRLKIIRQGQMLKCIEQIIEDMRFGKYIHIRRLAQGKKKEKTT